MFEEEAVKAGKKFIQCMDSYFEGDEYKKELALNVYKDGYQQGMVDGYNKANKWHFLSENPQDLPKNENYILLYLGEELKVSIGRFFPWCAVWETGKGPVPVIAWKEIIPPKFTE